MLDTTVEEKDFWAPNSEPQKTFLALPYEIFEAFYGGAAGGGKSEALLYYPIVHKFHEHPLYKGIIFRRTYKQLNDSLVPRAIDIYQKRFGARYNDTKHMFTFPSGARQYLSYLESDADAKQYDTAEFNLVSFEELTHFTQWQYTRLFSRCRTSSNLPAIMRSGGMPGNIGHSWVKKRFIDPDKGGLVKIYDEPSKTFRIFIRAFAVDNKDLQEKDPNYTNRLRLLPAAEAKALIEGDWDAFAGQVFTEFRILPNHTEPEIACHVIEPFQIPGYWPKFIAIDPGWRHNAAILWFAVAPDGRVFLYREYVQRGQYIEEYGANIKRMSQLDENLVDFIIDPAAMQRRGELKNVKEQLEDATNWNFTLADNDRVGGRLLIHEYLRWADRPKKYVPPEGFQESSYDRIFRTYGSKAAEEYKSVFEPDPEEHNIPKLQIFNTCQKLIEAIPTCVFDEKKVEDIAEFDGDDPIAALRYGLKRVHLWINESARKYKDQLTISQIMTDFTKNNDFFSLNMRMEAYEADHKVVTLVRKRKVFVPGMYRERPYYH